MKPFRALTDGGPFALNKEKQYETDQKIISYKRNFLVALFFHKIPPFLQILCGNMKYQFLFWRAASQRITDAAVDTLNEFTFPYIGIETM